MNARKIQIASDLHLEFQEDGRPDANLYEPVLDRDILVLAGDIGVGLGARDFVLGELEFSPVIYVPGNHEYYGNMARAEIDAQWLQIATNYENFFYLLGKSVVVEGLRFWGAPWYTDLWGVQDAWLPLVLHRGVADFNAYQKEKWTVRDHLESHKRQTKLLLDEKSPIDVVVTHWPPTKEAIHSRFVNDKLNPYFINDAEEIVRKVSPKLWVSGHTHESYDYWIGTTRCVGNPSGYPGEWRESTHFQRSRIVLVECSA